MLAGREAKQIGRKKSGYIDVRTHAPGLVRESPTQEGRSRGGGGEELDL